MNIFDRIQEIMDKEEMSSRARLLLTYMMEESRDNGFHGIAPREQIALIWGIEDVHDVANQRHPDFDVNEEYEGPNLLTDDQASEALGQVHNSHDANLGVCWNTIECAIDDIIAKYNITTS